MILFDEFEKAHRDVSNVLLQLMDNGTLTDGQGRTVDFRNTIVVLTSNLGAEYLARLPEGLPSSAARDEVMQVVRAELRPEFINRLDDIVLFNRLSRQNMDGIVDIQLRGVQSLLDERRIKLEITPKAKTWYVDHLHLQPCTRVLFVVVVVVWFSCYFYRLADQGYDPVYGARPLKRTIQRSMLNPMSTMILDGTANDGNVIEVDVNPNDPESLLITARERTVQEPQLADEEDLAESSEDEGDASR